MKWIKYLKRTPIAQIRADWSEYVGLWRQCVALRACRRAARDKITATVNGEDKTANNPSCIRNEYLFAPSFGARASDNGSDSAIYVRYSVCRVFNRTGDDTKCAKSDCPYIGRNHEYVDVCERYNVMRRARRDFWQVKFEQANQNVK